MTIHLKWMQKALDAAETRCGFCAPNPSVGAVLVSSAGECIGTGTHWACGYNHAERDAIEKAGEVPPGATLYVTLEPCTMCAGAISFARIRRLYYGAEDEKGGGVDHGVRFFSQPTCHHAPDIYGGILERQAGELLRAFFKRRR